MIKSYIGNNIRNKRIERGYSQTYLGKLIGKSNQAISSWELNRTEPSMGDVEMLANALNCSKSDLIGSVSNTIPSIADVEDHVRLIDFYDKCDDECKKQIMDVAAALAYKCSLR